VIGERAKARLPIMKGLKKNWNNFLRIDQKSLSERPSLSREGSQTVLIRITPRRVPGWTLVCRSSHSKKNTIQWLIAKSFLKILSKQERELLLLATLDAPDYLKLLIDWSLDLSITRDKKVAAAKLLEETVSGLSWLSIRQLNSYEPFVRFFKIWTRRASLAPERYIGVGYKDKGSLASSPSWKDQMLADGEESSVIDRIQFILNLFR